MHQSVTENVTTAEVSPFNPVMYIPVDYTSKSLIQILIYVQKDVNNISVIYGVGRFLRVLMPSPVKEV